MIVNICQRFDLWFENPLVNIFNNLENCNNHCQTTPQIVWKHSYWIFKQGPLNLICRKPITDIMVLEESRYLLQRTELGASQIKILGTRGKGLELGHAFTLQGSDFTPNICMYYLTRYVCITFIAIESESQNQFLKAYFTTQKKKTQNKERQ